SSSASVSSCAAGPAASGVAPVLCSAVSRSSPPSSAGGGVGAACVEPSLRPPAVRPREPPSRDFRNREVTRPRYLNASYRRDWLAEQGAERERLYTSRPLISDVQPLSHLVSSAAPGSRCDGTGSLAAAEGRWARVG